MKLALFSLCNLSLFILLFSSISLSGQINSEHYKIYSVKLNKEVSLQDIAEDMTNADVLFFGEEHNDSVTHYLEAKMLEALYQKFKNQLVLSMEMFDRDVQNVVNEYLKDQIRERNFVKDARTWSNYRDYRPMVEFAKTNQLDLICANAPTRYTNLAGRKGQGELKKLTKDAKNHFAPLPYKMASGGYLAKLNALTSHTPPASSDTTAAKKMPVMAMGNFDLISAQSLWDATMAYSIAEYLKKNKSKKVMQVSGRFHSDERFAIVTQLEYYRSKTKSLVISAGSDPGFPDVDWSKHIHLGDYIIITDPNVPKTYK